MNEVQIEDNPNFARPARHPRIRSCQGRLKRNQWLKDITEQLDSGFGERLGVTREGGPICFPGVVAHSICK